VAVVTGASSGIGKEFARQLAAHGINLVLVARRLAELEAHEKELAQQYGVECRPVRVDLSMADAVTAIEAAAGEIDLGLVVSNAGMGGIGSFWPGESIAASKDDLYPIVRLNSIAQLDIAHLFFRRLAALKRGGLILGGTSGASEGIPLMATVGATKAFVHSLGEAKAARALGPKGKAGDAKAQGSGDTRAAERRSNRSELRNQRAEFP
jgi:short-subunit dehydrogenase